jgi:CubicO group peptidase (beta-lactamase class C family)
VEDLSRFMISQLNEEENVLSEKSISLMHEKAVDGGGHINKSGYGLGFTHLSHEAWQYYGEFYGLDDAIGHEGGQIGYMTSFYFVEEEEGGYGIILLSNLSTIENGTDFGWYFPVYYKIHTLLIDEAKQLHTHVHITGEKGVIRID